MKSLHILLLSLSTFLFACTPMVTGSTPGQETAVFEVA